MARSEGVARGTLYGLSLGALTVGLIVINILVLRANPVKETPHFYLALGDSISFGYQPNLNFSSGFVEDVYGDLSRAGTTRLTNYACPGETTSTMISGNCPAKELRHDQYTGPQLDAAVNFLKAHPGRVNPVTLEIGSNDVLPDFDTSTCSRATNADGDLALMDSNLVSVILPKLVNALTSPTGVRTGDLHLLNYYDPYAEQCPDSLQFVQAFNEHLAADAAQFKVAVVDVYKAFGGDSQADKVCNPDHTVAFTWYCVPGYGDVHPTTAGYQAIADAVSNTLGLPGSNKAPLGVGGDGATGSVSWRRAS